MLHRWTRWPYEHLRFKNQWIIIPFILALGIFSGGVLPSGYDSFIVQLITVLAMTSYCIFKYLTYDGDRKFEVEKEERKLRKKSNKASVLHENKKE